MVRFVQMNRDNVNTLSMRDRLTSATCSALDLDERHRDVAAETKPLALAFAKRQGHGVGGSMYAASDPRSRRALQPPSCFDASSGRAAYMQRDARLPGLPDEMRPRETVLTRNTRMFDVLRASGISVPCGTTADI